MCEQQNPGAKHVLEMMQEYNTIEDIFERNKGQLGYVFQDKLTIDTVYDLFSFSKKK
jgi:hypothetical protein